MGGADPLPNVPACSGMTPEHCEHWGVLTTLGCGDMALGEEGLTHHPQMTSDFISTKAIAAGQKEIPPAAVQVSDGYLLLGIHTHICASANLRWVRSLQEADISTSERRKKDMGSDTCHQCEPLCPCEWLGISSAPLQNTHSQVHEHVPITPLKLLRSSAHNPARLFEQQDLQTCS